MNADDTPDDPVCPDCGSDDIGVISGTSPSGLHYEAKYCRECAWTGDPE